MLRDDEFDGGGAEAAALQGRRAGRDAFGDQEAAGLQDEFGAGGQHGDRTGSRAEAQRGEPDRRGLTGEAADAVGDVRAGRPRGELIAHDRGDRGDPAAVIAHEPGFAAEGEREVGAEGAGEAVGGRGREAAVGRETARRAEQTDGAGIGRAGDAGEIKQQGLAGRGAQVELRVPRGEHEAGEGLGAGTGAGLQGQRAAAEVEVGARRQLGRAGGREIKAQFALVEARGHGGVRQAGVGAGEDDQAWAELDETRAAGEVGGDRAAQQADAAAPIGRGGREREEAGAGHHAFEAGRAVAEVEARGDEVEAAQLERADRARGGVAEQDEVQATFVVRPADMVGGERDGAAIAGVEAVAGPDGVSEGTRAGQDQAGVGARDDDVVRDRVERATERPAAGSDVEVGGGASLSETAEKRALEGGVGGREEDAEAGRIESARVGHRGGGVAGEAQVGVRGGRQPAVGRLAGAAGEDQRTAGQRDGRAAAEVARRTADVGDGGEFHGEAGAEREITGERVRAAEPQHRRRGRPARRIQRQVTRAARLTDDRVEDDGGAAGEEIERAVVGQGDRTGEVGDGVGDVGEIHARLRGSARTAQGERAGEIHGEGRGDGAGDVVEVQLPVGRAGGGRDREVVRYRPGGGVGALPAELAGREGDRPGAETGFSVRLHGPAEDVQTARPGRVLEVIERERAADLIKIRDRVDAVDRQPAGTGDATGEGDIARRGRQDRRSVFAEIDRRGGQQGHGAGVGLGRGAGREHAARQGQRIREGGRGGVHVEGAGVDAHGSEVREEGRTEGGAAAQLEGAARDQEIGRGGEVERRLRGRRQDDATGAGLGDVTGALQGAEGEDGSGVGHEPGLVGAELHAGGHVDRGRSAGEDGEAGGGKLRSDLESVGGGRARRDIHRDRREGRVGRRLEGERVDLEVLLERRAHRRGGSRVPLEDHVGPLPRDRGRRRRAGLVLRPVVGGAVPRRAAQAAPVGHPGDEVAGGDAHGRVGDVPGERGEAAGRRALEDVPRPEGGEASVGQRQQRVRLVGVEPGIAEVEGDRAAEGQGASREQAQGVGVAAVAGAGDVADVKRQRGGAGAGARAQAERGERREVAADVVAGEAERGAGPDGQRSDERGLREAAREGEAGPAGGGQGVGRGDRSVEGEDAALRERGALVRVGAAREGGRARADLAEREGARAGVGDGAVEREILVASAEGELGGVAGGIREDRRAGRGRQPAQGVGPAVEVEGRGGARRGVEGEVDGRDQRGSREEVGEDAVGAEAQGAVGDTEGPAVRGGGGAAEGQAAGAGIAEAERERRRGGDVPADDRVARSGDVPDAAAGGDFVDGDRRKHQRLPGGQVVRQTGTVGRGADGQGLRERERVVAHEGDRGVVGDLRDIGEHTVAAEGEDRAGAEAEQAGTEGGVRRDAERAGVHVGLSGIAVRSIAEDPHGRAVDLHRQRAAVVGEDAGDGVAGHVRAAQQEGLGADAEVVGQVGEHERAGAAGMDLGVARGGVEADLTVGDLARTDVHEDAPAGARVAEQQRRSVEVGARGRTERRRPGHRAAAERRDDELAGRDGRRAVIGVRPAEHQQTGAGLHEPADRTGAVADHAAEHRVVGEGRGVVVDVDRPRGARDVDRITEVDDAQGDRRRQLQGGAHGHEAALPPRERRRRAEAAKGDDQGGVGGGEAAAGRAGPRDGLRAGDGGGRQGADETSLGLQDAHRGGGAEHERAAGRQGTGGGEHERTVAHRSEAGVSVGGVGEHPDARARLGHGGDVGPRAAVGEAREQRVVAGRGPREDERLRPDHAEGDIAGVAPDDGVTVARGARERGAGARQGEETVGRDRGRAEGVGQEPDGSGVVETARRAVEDQARRVGRGVTGADAAGLAEVGHDLDVDQGGPAEAGEPRVRRDAVPVLAGGAGLHDIEHADAILEGARPRAAAGGVADDEGRRAGGVVRDHAGAVEGIETDGVAAEIEDAPLPQVQRAEGGDAVAAQPGAGAEFDLALVEVDRARERVRRAVEHQLAFAVLVQAAREAREAAVDGQDIAGLVDPDGQVGRARTGDVGAGDARGPAGGEDVAVGVGGAVVHRQRPGQRERDAALELQGLLRDRGRAGVGRQVAVLAGRKHVDGVEVRVGAVDRRAHDAVVEDADVGAVEIDALGAEADEGAHLDGSARPRDDVQGRIGVRHQGGELQQGGAGQTRGDPDGRRAGREVEGAKPLDARRARGADVFEHAAGVLRRRKTLEGEGARIRHQVARRPRRERILEAQGPVRDEGVAGEGVGTRERPGARSVLLDGRSVGRAVLDDGPGDQVFGGVRAGEDQRLGARAGGQEGGVEDDRVGARLAGRDRSRAGRAREVDDLVGDEAGRRRRRARLADDQAPGGRGRTDVDALGVVIDGAEFGDGQRPVVDVDRAVERRAGAGDAQEARAGLGEDMVERRRGRDEVARERGVARAAEGQRTITRVLGVAPEITREEDRAAGVVGDRAVGVAALDRRGGERITEAVAAIEHEREVLLEGERAEGDRAIEHVIAADGMVGEERGGGGGTAVVDVAGRAEVRVIQADFDGTTVQVEHAAGAGGGAGAEHAQGLHADGAAGRADHAREAGSIRRTQEERARGILVEAARPRQDAAEEIVAVAAGVDAAERHELGTGGPGDVQGAGHRQQPAFGDDAVVHQPDGAGQRAGERVVADRKDRGAAVGDRPLPLQAHVPGQSDAAGEHELAAGLTARGRAEDGDGGRVGAEGVAAREHERAVRDRGEAGESPGRGEPQRAAAGLGETVVAGEPDAELGLQRASHEDLGRGLPVRRREREPGPGEPVTVADEDQPADGQRGSQGHDTARAGEIGAVVLREGADHGGVQAGQVARPEGRGGIPATRAAYARVRAVGVPIEVRRAAVRRRQGQAGGGEEGEAGEAGKGGGHGGKRRVRGQDAGRRPV